MTKMEKIDELRYINFKQIKDESDSDSSDVDEWSMDRKRNGMKKIKNMNLPNNLITPPTKGDKSFNESWLDKKGLLNIPCPVRCLLSGNPNSGKSYNIYNLLIRQDPPFEKIYILHMDKSSKDYYGIKFEEQFVEIPDPLYWKDDKQSKKCLIIEDVAFTNLSKIEKKRFNRLMGFTSSHCNLSIYLTTQNFTDIGADIRRMGNLFVLFKQPDLNALVILSRRVGMDKDDFMKIFNTYLKKTHTALYIDLQNDSPAKYRINGFKPIRRDENGEWVEYTIL